ncbi:hypothetical protein [Microvirga lenta]|uniref:hypothetical protein n=1 Tax=Microvirga lenta TaxID=2881337 RepID=UPI001CFFAB4D|nr:hypothetical protein [Microvirga lenta]MCB5177553.1 hypothetical protein [Microvirga lenta]
MKPAAFTLGLFLLGLPLTSLNAEDLVARREACRAQAKRHLTVRGKTKVATEEYRQIVERRRAHVEACMASTQVAQDQLPVPPKRPSI